MLFLARELLSAIDTGMDGVGLDEPVNDPFGKIMGWILENIDLMVLRS
jgi:hypothetical protein